MSESTPSQSKSSVSKTAAGATGAVNATGGAATAAASAKFGTFGGVFTPCVLTILGVIMFLRFGDVVGNAGVINTLLIVLVAKAITTLTTLSLSAIATNTRTKGGGAYFLISRSLGVEFGGAIGMVFFLAQAISVSMYVMGFAEAFVGTFSGLGLSLEVVGTATNVLVFACVMIGAGWTIKVQYGILAVLLLSLVSFGAGVPQAFSVETFQANLAPGYTMGESWVTMFALFFPAVTGIMAGANMSGDLKNPARSIPRGTLWAIGFTAVIYLALALLLGGLKTREGLVGSNMLLNDVAVVPWLITAGVFAATLSSALGSMMGSPRILQAFARDRVLPVLTPFATGSGAGNEPRRATILTFAIAQVCILSADLNAIAPVITMAFMITYGTLNLASFYESFTKNPSYRPQFRFCHWSASLLGALACFGVMVVLDWMWALVAICGMAGLYWLIAQREFQSNWGDVKSGLAFERARRNLSILEDESYHPKNWRPMLLTMSGAGDSRRHLAVYGHWLTAGHGIQTLGQVIEGELSELMDRRAAQRKVLRSFIRDQNLSAFPAVVVAPTVGDGVAALVQAHGLGGLEPNMVLLGWPNAQKASEEGGVESSKAFAKLLRTIARLNRSLVLIRSREGNEDVFTPPPGTLDVWWRGRDNGPLMLMMAHLLTKNAEWRRHRIRLLRCVPNEAAAVEVHKHLVELASTSRIRVEAKVFVTDNPPATIRRESARAAVVFLGFAPPEDESADAGFFNTVDTLLGDLPRVAMVNNAGGVALES
ncbi:MAG: amino acid permease [Algisphaera sp.]